MSRRVHLIEEPFYRPDYLENKPIARIIHCINENNVLYLNTAVRNVFKRKIEAKLTEVANDQL